MEKGRVIPVLLIIGSIFIIIYRYLGSTNRISIYIILFTLISTIIISYLLNKKIIKINKIVLQSNLYNIITDKDQYCGIILRIIGKTDTSSTSRSILEEELRKLSMSLARRQSGFHYVFTTSIYEGKMGSAIIIYKKCNDEDKTSMISDIEKEVNDVYNISRAISPHLDLIPSSTSSTIVPLPSIFGNIPYLYAPERTFSPSTNEMLIYEYDLPLGEAMSSFGRTEVGIKLSDLTRHIGIFGSTGSGKSTTASHLAIQAFKKGVNIVILDWHGEYRELIPNDINIMFYNKINILKINLNQIISNDINDAVDIFGDVMQLTDPQRFLLYTVLNKLKKNPELSFKNLLTILRNIEETSNWIRDVKYALARKFFILFGKEGRNLFSTDGLTLDNLGSYIKGFVIIDISNIKNTKLRRLYGLLIMKLISDYYMEKKPSKKTMIIVDEAHNYFSEKNDFTDRLVSEIRKYGISFCIVSQSPSSLSPEIMKNTNIKIVHAIKSDIDKRSIRESLSLDERIISSLDKLDVGEALLSAPNIKKAIIINIKRKNIKTN